MTKKHWLILLCLTLCVLLAISAAGCKKSETADESSFDDSGINACDKLASMLTSDEELGIKGKYNSLADIQGSIDPDIVGKWVTADGKTAYIYNEDGTFQVETSESGTPQIVSPNGLRYTCFEEGGKKLICEEAPMTVEHADGTGEESITLSYAVYEIANDALYQVIVEETGEDSTSYQAALVTTFRTDETGSFVESMKKNPISLASLNGTWTSDKGDVTIKNGKLTVGDDTYDLSFTDENKLVVEKDGKSTVYSLAFTMLKEYDYDDRTKVTGISNAFGIYYTGEDENDIPNLVSVLDDWKTEYEWDSWYYTGNFTRQG